MHAWVLDVCIYLCMYVCICKGELVGQPVIGARFDISYHFVQYCREEGRGGRESKVGKVPQVVARG